MHESIEGGCADRLKIIQSRIATALIGSGRKTQDVTLIAVSKGHSVESIRELYRLGVRDFGESYAGEFCKKFEETVDLADIRWHFIGHLQSNKAKRVALMRPLIHSLDRPSLLRELSKFASPSEPLKVLVQLQIDPDDVNKSGCTAEEAHEICRQLAQTPGLEWEGFMGIGPASASAEKLMWLYDQFRSRALLLWDQYSRRDPSRRTREVKLSLGMSDDLEIALRSGSNIIRVGSALFGPRPGKTQAT
ncbi:MAG: hypothetical protein RLZZ488_2284 [Pseudomonadota bacterium]|jgi:pyridoxal phosphate enzyme (YggS family)